MVPAGVWQGAISTGTMSLVGTTMAPPYEQRDFELGIPTRWPAVIRPFAGLARPRTRSVEAP